MPLLGRISFVLGAMAVTLLALGCAARHEPTPTVAAVAAPPSAPAIPVPAPTWPDVAAVPPAPVPEAAGPVPGPERMAEFASREELKDVPFASDRAQVERRPVSRITAVSRGDNGTLCVDRRAACPSRSRRVHVRCA